MTSATLDAENFSKYFYSCPIFTIPGRMYPVETLYTKEPETDYMDAALITVMQIHLSEPPGDILLFLTGQEEINTACEILFERMKALSPKVPDLIILPIYSALPSELECLGVQRPSYGSQKPWASGWSAWEFLGYSSSPPSLWYHRLFLLFALIPLRLRLQRALTRGLLKTAYLREVASRIPST